MSVEDAAQEVEEPESDSAHVTTSQHEEVVNVEGLPIRRRTSRKARGFRPSVRARTYDRGRHKSISGCTDKGGRRPDAISEKAEWIKKKGSQALRQRGACQKFQEAPTVRPAQRRATQ